MNNLEEHIKNQIANVKLGKVDDNIVEFVNYKNKYTILKPRVTVKVELTSGKVAKIDVTDFFKEVIE